MTDQKPTAPRTLPPQTCSGCRHRTQQRMCIVLGTHRASLVKAADTCHLWQDMTAPSGRHSNRG